MPRKFALRGPTGFWTWTHQNPTLLQIVSFTNLSGLCAPKVRSNHWERVGFWRHYGKSACSNFADFFRVAAAVSPGKPDQPNEEVCEACGTRKRFLTLLPRLPPLHSLEPLLFRPKRIALHSFLTFAPTPPLSNSIISSDLFLLILTGLVPVLRLSTWKIWVDPKNSWLAMPAPTRRSCSSPILPVASQPTMSQQSSTITRLI